VSEQIEIKMMDMQVLSLQPGDKVVLRYASCMRAEQYARIKQEMEKVVPGHQVLILENGMEIGVLRDDSAEGTG
jgi:hypothetical protein